MHLPAQTKALLVIRTVRPTHSPSSTRPQPMLRSVGACLWET